MKKIIIIIALLTIPALAQQEFQQEYIQSADKIDKLYIECGAGRIYCEPSDGNDIKVYVKKIIYLNDDMEAKELADACEVEFNEDRRKLEVIIDLPRRSYSKRGLFNKIFDSVRNDDLEILVKVLIPADIETEIETSSADIYASNLTNNDFDINGSSADVSLENIKGNCMIDLSSGDLEAFHVEGKIDLSGSSSDFELEDVTGDIRISTSSGDGIIEKAKGNLDLRTSSGDIRLYGLEGDLYCRSSSGDFDGENISGSVRAGSTSGTINLKRLSNKLGRFQAESTSGDVYLEVPEGFEGRLELESVSGSINSNLAMSMNRHSRNYVAGSVGGGDGEIEIETTSGDITVETY